MQGVSLATLPTLQSAGSIKSPSHVATRVVRRDALFTDTIGIVKKVLKTSKTEQLLLGTQKISMQSTLLLPE